MTVVSHGSLPFSGLRRFSGALMALTDDCPRTEREDSRGLAGPAAATGHSQRVASRASHLVSHMQAGAGLRRAGVRPARGAAAGGSWAHPDTDTSAASPPRLRPRARPAAQ